ncbi:unnamed protein product [Heterobilharzia americana]|nr:unnamed protein product [Heterobilharzia americana]
MFMSAYEFESNQFEVDSQENASKISNPPKSEKPLIASNQNPLNHPKAYWFRLHNGYSGKDDFMDTENTIQNHLSTSTISHPVALNKSIDKFKSDSQNSDYDNLSVVQSIYVQNCTPNHLTRL